MVLSEIKEKIAALKAERKAKMCIRDRHRGNAADHSHAFEGLTGDLPQAIPGDQGLQPAAVREGLGNAEHHSSQQDNCQFGWAAVMDFLLYFGNADQVKVELSSGDSEAVAQVDYLFTGALAGKWIAVIVDRF